MLPRLGALQPASAASPTVASARAGVVGRLDCATVTEPNAAWIPRAEWDALVRGEGCPLCRDLASTTTSNQYRHVVADLAVSQLWLGANQSVPGYCVVVCSRHVPEPYDLPPDRCAAFFDDLMRAARALEAVFRPTKMNFQILGNAIPHLHCHVVPRYYGDPAPGRPIEVDARTVHLTPAEYALRVELIRAALSKDGG
jgi:diadenosine tetraphosphate (Ap4A) HIT family hydrolase